MPEKDKLQALVLYASGLSMNRSAQRFGVSVSAVLKGGRSPYNQGYASKLKQHRHRSCQPRMTIFNALVQYFQFDWGYVSLRISPFSIGKWCKKLFF
ncbi:hypothetical protein HE1_00052 [Holospora elegans E1]|uniref:Uncharacterized protein n=1 Tax=Holospora elegans E1 TaxID=1427503 RepID=A0A023DWG4_9PROT|nr:hypothetical protein HE1_00052 [Holospora elegans E1]